MLTIAFKRAASPRLAGKLGLIALAVSFPSASLAPAYAQAVKNAPAPSSPVAAAPSPAVPPTSSAPAATVLAQIGRAAGVTIVADSAVGALQVQAPREPTTPANLEQQIAAITHQLPPGTDWAKLMLPAPAPGHPWKGDDVAQFASAAFRLYGASVFSSSSLPRSTAAAPVTPGSASAGPSLLAQTIPEEKSAQYTADLHLQPVYVVANSSVRSASNSMGSATLGDSPQLTQSQEIDKFLSGPKMLPALRDQILDQLQRDPNSVHVTPSIPIKDGSMQILTMPTEDGSSPK